MRGMVYPTNSWEGFGEILGGRAPSWLGNALNTLRDAAGNLLGVAWPGLVLSGARSVSWESLKGEPGKTSAGANGRGF